MRVRFGGERRLLGVVCTHFYDDYACVEAGIFASQGQGMLRSLHVLLGFPFSERKAVDED